LQHEFGIWGGTEGEYIIPFLERCNKPIVATLHTPSGRNSAQAEMLKRLCKKSARLVVLTERARQAIYSLVPECCDRIVVIRHGVPDVLYAPWSGKQKKKEHAVRFISPGFFRPDKGLATILGAFGVLKELGIAFEYRIVGGPQLQFDGQREYHDLVVELIQRYDLQRHVQVMRRFVDREGMIRDIREADCGVIGYSDLTQASSGIIPLILACGRPVISTPIEYSRETAASVSGLFLTAGVTVDAMLESLRYVIGRRDEIRNLMPIIYEGTRKWVWRRAAEQYLRVFRQACIDPVTALAR